MSFLQQDSGGPSGSKAIISFWVRVGHAGGASQEWPDKYDPPELRLARDEIMVAGGAYYPMALVFRPPHIKTYPSEGGHTWADGMVPFLTWGDPNQLFEEPKWKKKELDPDYYYFGPGGGHKKIVSMYPDEEAENKEREKVDDKGEKIKPGVKGIIPPSMIGCRNGGLRIVLQTSGKAKYTGFSWGQSKAQPVKVLTPIGPPVQFPPAPGLPDNVYAWANFAEGEGWINPGLKNPTFRGEALSYTDISHHDCARHPEAFIMDTGAGIADGGWHHILLSFDLTGGPEGKGATGSLPLGSEVPDKWDKDGKPTSYKRNPPEPPPKDEPGEIVVESTGPDGKEPYPGPYGQWPGPRGENALAAGYEWPEPREDVGKYGYATGGEFKSTCRAWLMVDGIEYKGRALNHRAAYKAIEGVDDNTIAPPNAFLAYNEEIRHEMVTSLTQWERFYRTALGAFLGPSAKLEDTKEKRRLDYERPKYEFKPGGLSSGPFAIPAGDLLPDRNYNISMAELHIWTGKSVDVSRPDIYDLFVKSGKPASIRKMDIALGSPSFRLHWATNWIHGRVNGQIKDEKTGEGPMKRTGQINRTSGP